MNLTSEQRSPIFDHNYILFFYIQNILQCRRHRKVVQLSESLESCLHEGYVLFSCVDPLWIQKYVSKFSCGRNKKEQQKFNKEVPVWSLQNILDKLFFGMEACKKCCKNDSMPFTWHNLCSLSIHLHSSFCYCVQINVCTFWQLWKCAVMFAACLCLNTIVLARNFQFKLNQGQRNANLVTIYFAKNKCLEVLHYARSASTFSECPPGALWCTRGHWTWQWWLLLLFFFSFGQEEKQGRVCALIHGSSQLTSDSADALVINNSFRTLVIFISVRNPTVSYLTHRWLRRGLVEMPLPFHSDIKDI